MKEIMEVFEGIDIRKILKTFEKFLKQNEKFGVNFERMVLGNFSGNLSEFWKSWAHFDKNFG